MVQDDYIVRDPLLDAEQSLIGYALHWARAAIDEANTQREAHALFDGLRNMFNDYEAGSQAGKLNYCCYIPASIALLQADVYIELPVRYAGLMVTPDILADTQANEVIRRMRQQGYDILLRRVDINAIRAEWLTTCNLVEVQFEAGNFSAQAKIYALRKQPNLRMAASSVKSWHEYAVCCKLGLTTFAGCFYLTPHPLATGKARALNPSQTILLRLMEGVRANAEINQLEELLKHDAAISYKLLFYINSAAFGLSVEIQSLRHAIQMLGYEHLYRWLCVLFATSEDAGAAPVLMHAALVRGRMIELLGRIHLSKADAENLFVTGMFSLIDRLLGISMEQAIENIWLPEAVIDALVTQTGIYAPFLALAHVCESGQATLNANLDALGVTTKQINQAHLEALFWAQGLLN